jgi:DNA-binding transcriptional LysR family regulator
MELRQLRYYVTLAEELHFGRAAAREHIVQSALSQQLQRLERELGVRLLERTTHHVRLTPAGSVFLLKARQILADVDRAAVAAQRAAGLAPTLRVGIVDASYDSMPQILREVWERYPDLEIHEVEAGVPEQFRMLMDGRLDVGLGRASLAPLEVAAELFRLDPLGVLVPDGHHLAALPAIPVATLAAEPMLLAEEGRAPEFNQFVIDLCRSVGFVPTVYRGTVDSIRAAANDLILQGRCVVCAPASCRAAVPQVVWRPLAQPMSWYPWSVLWRTEDQSEHVLAVVTGARRLSREFGWLQPSSQATG